MNCLGTESSDFVRAFLVRDIFHIAIAKRLVALGRIAADVGQHAQVAPAVAENLLDPCVTRGAAEGVEAHIHFAGSRPRLRAASHDVDYARYRLGTEQQALATLEHFDAFNGIGRQRVEVQATVQAVVQAHAIEQDQGVIVAPAEQGIGAIVEWAVLRRHVQPGNEHLHHPRHVG